MQTAKSTFTGGFWGGVSGFANFEIGNLENVYMKIAAHSVSEGAMEGIRGGHFEHGFFTGMADTKLNVSHLTISIFKNTINRK